MIEPKLVSVAVPASPTPPAPWINAPEPGVPLTTMLLAVPGLVGMRMAGKPEVVVVTTVPKLLTVPLVPKIEIPPLVPWIRPLAWLVTLPPEDRSIAWLPNPMIVPELLTVPQDSEIATPSATTVPLFATSAPDVILM